MLRTRNLAAAARRAFSTVTAEPKPLFDKILIANRGEIVLRVIKTARRLGIKTVAVYSEADSNAMHVRAADEAVCIGPAPSAQSYLRMDRILDACQKTGAQAVHPGYGFLSENAEFQKALQAEDIKFIGPGTRAITAMGDKIASKKIAHEAQVNTVPGHLGVVKTNEEVVKIAREIGYPVMIKASAGGGGKGMRIAWNDEEAIEGFALSTEEAKSSFGDERVFIEKFVVHPRHIEIQLVADQHGNVATFPERECSIQRRNQKVVEESPSVLLDAETRRNMQDQAAALARAVGYESAGTVEFLCDPEKNFYFLEMNTRLQVEHPVTEYVGQVDLVEQMLRVAAGLPLPEELLRRDRPINGHAVEVRVYAEDPFRGFLPSIGRLAAYHEPDPETIFVPPEDLRLDAGVGEGSEISMHYDPMIAKMITHGPDRATALARMRRAIDAYVIRGVGHNLPFLRDVTANARHEAGELSTAFIDEEYPEGFVGVSLLPLAQRRLAASALVMNLLDTMRDASVSGRYSTAPEPDLGGLRVVTVCGGPEGQPDQKFIGIVDQTDAAGYVAHLKPLSADADADADADVPFETVQFGNVEWGPADPLFSALVAIDGADGAADASGDEDDEAASDDEGVPAEPMYVQHGARLPEGYEVVMEGARRTVLVRTVAAERLARHMLPKPELDLSRVVVSPMPGTLISVDVEAGQTVQPGQAIAIVEAMKMQNVLRANKRAVVKAVVAEAGDTLDLDQVIVELDDA